MGSGSQFAFSIYPKGVQQSLDLCFTQDNNFFKPECHAGLEKQPSPNHWNNVST